MPASSSVADRSPVLSSETIRALKHYKYEVATYTLRQWNNAKIESERKERDRRRRRADLLAQRAAAAAAATASTAGSPNVTPSVTNQHRLNNATRRASGSPSSEPRRAAAAAAGSSSVAGAGLGKQRTSTNSGNHENGPLMMVSRRRSERSHNNPHALAPSSSYGAGSAHLPAAPVPPHHPRHHTTAPVVQFATGKRPQNQEGYEPHRSRHQRHKSHSPARGGAFDQTSNLSSYAFDRPTIHHLESVITSLDLNGSDHPSGSASTPPIAIPTRANNEDEDLFVQSVPSNVSSPSSPSSNRKRPARVLGFAAHLGMTSISNEDAKGSSIPSSLVGLSDSASTSNSTSEGSSRMGSFSETNHTLNNVGLALKDVADQTPMADNLDAWPIRMYGEGIRVQGDDEHVFGPMDHH